MSQISSQFVTGVNAERTVKLRVSAKAAETDTPWSFESYYGNNSMLDTVKAIELISCSITHTVPNVSAIQGNNVFELITTSGTFSYTMPDGFYSVSEINNVLQPLLNTYISPSISSFGLTSNGLFRIEITSGAAQIRNSANNSLGGLLGYETLNAFTTNLVADILPALSGISYFHIVSRKIGANCFTNSVTGTNSGNCLFSIPVTVPFGYQNVFENNNSLERITLQGQLSLKNFDIILLDENFRILTDMDPRSRVELIIQVIY